MSLNLYHNKKRNSALLYEFLVRHLTSCIFENNNKDANRALLMLKKYFHMENSPLRSEMKASKLILDSRTGNRDTLAKIINDVCSFVKRIAKARLVSEKSELIREINYTFGKDTVWKYKIPNYKLYASIQTLFNGLDGKKVEDSVNRAKLEETIIESLSKSNQKTTIVENMQTNPKYTKAVHRFIVKRFNEKYSNKLNENQVKLLMRYATFLVNHDSRGFDRFVESEIKRIRGSLVDVKDETIKDDQVLKTRINECLEKLSDIPRTNLEDKNIVELLKYMALVNELNNCNNNDTKK